MARLSRQESRRLLDAAFDAGITHFDTARMYGYGAAEGVLGDFLATRRGRVTITSKVGILPPKRSRLMGTARSVARALASLHPAVRQAMRRRAEAMTQRGCFDPDTVRASVDTSLRELRTDTLDFLLLHDCTLDDLADPALLPCLEALVRQGKARQIGLATSFTVCAAAHTAHPALTQVVQFANNPWQPATAEAGWLAGRTVFTHSALGARFHALVPALAANPALAASWTNRLGFDAADTARLAEALLGASLAANPGCVLFSTKRPAAIAANVRVQPQPAIWDALRDLAATVPLEQERQ